MSSLKESSTSGKESTPAPIIRRSKAMPIDSPGAKFLYTILKQLDLKGIDWNMVASQLDISNGHAARMRYHRYRNQMEGINPQQRKKQTNRVSKPASNPLKTGQKKVSSPETSPVIKSEPSSSSSCEPNAYIKTEQPYAQQLPQFTDMMPYGQASSMVSSPYPHSTAFSSPMTAPYQHQMNIAPELRTYPSTPPYPPVPAYETGYRPPVSWTPVKAEPRVLSEEHNDLEIIEPPVKEEVPENSS